MSAISFEKDGIAIDDHELLKLEIERSRYIMSLIFARIGTEGFLKIFAEDLKLQAQEEAAAIESSGGRLRGSVVRAHVKGGSSAEFLQWFLDGYMGPNSAAMMRAHPEHLGTVPFPGGVQIFEVPGHTDRPATLRLVQLAEWTEPAIPLKPDMPHRLMGRFEDMEGRTYGYLLHQLCDTADGFEAELSCYWPANSEERLFDGHADHLMVEFNNWFKAYLRTRVQPDNLMPLALTLL